MSTSQLPTDYPTATDPRSHQEYIREQNAASFGVGPVHGNVSRKQRPGQQSSAGSTHSNLSTSRDVEDVSHTHRDVDHIKKIFGPVLVAALSELCLRRPSDPLEYLAHWLLRYRYNEEYKRGEVDKAVEVISENELVKAQQLGNTISELKLESQDEGYGLGKPYSFGEFEGKDQQDRQLEVKMSHKMHSDELCGESTTSEEEGDEYETVDHTGEKEDASDARSTRQSKLDPPRERGLGTLMEMKPFIQTLYSKPQ